VALLTVRVGPADVGRRVSLRHRLSGEGPGSSDLVGILTSWDVADGVLRVRRRSGDEVSVAAAALLGGHVVAPEWGAYDLQQVAQAGWRPRETADLAGWEARWSDGIGGRANSVRVTGDVGVGLGPRLEAARAWYRARGAEPLLQSPSPSVWDAALDERGWTVVRRTLLLTAPTAEVLDACRRRRTAAWPDVVGADEPTPRWVAAMDEPAADREGVASILRRTPVARYAAAVEEAGGTVAIARASVTPGPGRRSRERWAQVTSLHTLPGARRRGAATALMADLAAWSVERGAPHVLLQTLAANDPALALYRDLGFAVHHAYEYRRPAPGAVAR
jgi:ribosomal protein S18 acetylase RimI-like enzyme